MIAPLNRKKSNCNHSLLLVVLLLSAPFLSALVTYTFVSLPDASIALDTKGTLLLMVVMLEIFLIGSTGVFPIDLNKLVQMRGRRGTAWENEGSFVDDFPCSVRILCELETAARTYDGDSSSEPSKEEMKTSNSSEDDDEAFQSQLLEIDWIEEYQREAVRALSLNESQSNDALYRLASITEGGVCEEAYFRCSQTLSPKDSIKIMFEEFGVGKRN